MLKKKLTSLLSIEEVRCHKMVACLNGLPKGKLYIRRKGDAFRYSVYLNGKEKGITRNQDLIESFLRKEPLEKRLSESQMACKVLKDAINSMTALEYDDPISKIWSEEPNDGNSYRPEHLKYQTLKGHLVRSKSERFIADTLFRLKIPYRYEFPLSFEGYKLHPDFTILKPDGNYILWEHFGLLDNEDYLKNAMHKVKLYKSAGFSQHTNLICTTEKDLTEKSVIEDIILRFFFS